MSYKYSHVLVWKNKVKFPSWTTKLVRVKATTATKSKIFSSLKLLNYIKQLFMLNTVSQVYFNKKKTNFFNTVKVSGSSEPGKVIYLSGSYEPLKKYISHQH
jgi:hypothetical protein